MEKMEQPIKLKELLLQLEIDYINRALNTKNGNITQAANLLGINRTTLVEKMRVLYGKIIIPVKVRPVYKYEIEREKKLEKEKKTIEKKEQVKKIEQIMITKPGVIPPKDTVRYEGWTNKDTYLCATIIDSMHIRSIKKIGFISRTGIQLKSRILAVIERANTNIRLKISNVNFEEIAKEYEHV
jgi:hypothetical protein